MLWWFYALGSSVSYHLCAFHSSHTAQTVLSAANRPNRLKGGMVVSVSPAYARGLVGQRVRCHSSYGTHVGILHEVRRDGILLSVPRGRVGSASGPVKIDFHHADQPGTPDVSEAFFPFFFFFPFFALFALAAFEFERFERFPFRRFDRFERFERFERFPFRRFR